MTQLLNSIKALPGYKISNSHYRIGSKLHLSDFYYAKRFFQNNFFASRFAFLLTKKIIDTLSPDQLDDCKEKGLTLIGYGIYSELLLSLVKKFLKKEADFADEFLRHNLVIDTEKPELAKKEKIAGYALIIVPIASTFSTAMKMEEFIKKKEPSSIILQPHFNLLYIADRDEEHETTPIEQEFGWVKKDISKKEIYVNAFFDSVSPQRVEKYFLCLTSKWQKIEKCEDCFPGNLLEEKPLFETDRSSVTPRIIFDYPKGRAQGPEDAKKGYVLTPRMVEYGHLVRNNSHFIYSIDTELFLDKNTGAVKQWLRKIKTNKAFKADFPSTARILIVSSCHHSNTAFINLLNEEFFSSSANIIHYDPVNDYIQNFDMMYGVEIRTATKIIFVDDALKSGKTFFKIDEFLRHTLTVRGKGNSIEKNTATGIDSCYLLINKSQPFIHDAVTQRLIGKNGIQSFANLNLYTSLSHDEPSFLTLEEDRYETLVDNSFLDSLKVFFMTQASKLKKGLRRNNHEDELSDERHLLMLEATHRLYQYFARPAIDISDFANFEQFIQSFEKNTNNPVGYASEKKLGLMHFTLQQTCVLKVLTQSPFTQYEPLKKMVFRWVISLLEQQINTVTSGIKTMTLDYNDFHDLKFLIRRTGLLNSNYLISSKMFSCLNDLYGPGGLSSLDMASTHHRDIGIEKQAGLFDKQELNKILVPKNIQEKNIKDFHVFFVAQVKELLLLNEARCIKLERQLLSLPGKLNIGFLQIVRMLFTENSIVIQKFYDYLCKIDDWGKVYHPDDSPGPMGNKTSPITKFLEENEVVKNSQRYRVLSDFFIGLDRKPVPENDLLLIYLWVQYFIEFDYKQGYSPLTEKTEQLFEKLKAILHFTNAEGREISLTGAFFIVKDNENTSYLVYDKNSKSSAELDPITWKNPEDALLQDFIEGMKDVSGSYHKTIIELKRNTVTKKWDDLYSTAEKPGEIKLRYEFLPDDINRIILVRINKRVPDDGDKPLGLMGFYFKSESEELTDMYRSRYLVLLKSAMCLFVEKHHQNNEFRDWLIAENTKKMALLSGHGKEMLRDIAQDDLRFRTIILNLEHLQMIILLNEGIKANEGIEDVQKTFNKFYHVGGLSTVTQDYLDDLESMAKQIYSSDKIETDVEIEVRKEKPGYDINFAFNKDILDLICFELIINAKKNRWIFSGEDEIPGIRKNYLNFGIKIVAVDKDSWLEISITNSGPLPDSEIFKELNSRYKNIKQDDITAGTSLIKTLIMRILGAKILFKPKVVYRESRFGEFIVTMTFKEMKDDQTKNSGGRESVHAV